MQYVPMRSQAIRILKNGWTKPWRRKNKTPTTTSSKILLQHFLIFAQKIEQKKRLASNFLKYRTPTANSPIKPCQRRPKNRPNAGTGTRTSSWPCKSTLTSTPKTSSPCRNWRKKTRRRDWAASRTTKTTLPTMYVGRWFLAFLGLFFSASLQFRVP